MRRFLVLPLLLALASCGTGGSVSKARVQAQKDAYCVGIGLLAGCLD